MNVPWYEIDWFAFCFLFIFAIYGFAMLLAVIYLIMELFNLFF